MKPFGETMNPNPVVSYISAVGVENVNTGLLAYLCSLTETAIKVGN
jgi:hypothetical protein